MTTNILCTVFCGKFLYCFLTDFILTSIKALSTYNNIIQINVVIYLNCICQLFYFGTKNECQL